MIGLTQISGSVGKGIEFMQMLNGDGFEIWEHAFILLPNNQILEAEPGGAVIRELHYEDVYWCSNLDKLLSPSVSPTDVMAVARKLEGVPYSFLDYAALVGHRLRIPAVCLKQYISSTNHMICSQMCDEVYRRLGAQVFDDGRWPGYVTPGSLFKRDLELR